MFLSFMWLYFTEHCHLLAEVGWGEGEVWSGLYAKAESIIFTVNPFNLSETPFPHHICIEWICFLIIQ